MTLALMIGGPIPSASAAPTVPEAPVVAGRAPVTPTITSIPAAASVTAQATTVSAQSTTVGTQNVLAEVPARDTATFNLVGATWTASTGAVTLQMQTKTATGWSDWTNLSDENSSDLGDKPANSVADPSYVGDATGIALRAVGAAGSSITGLTAKTITSPAVAADSHLGTVTAQAVAGAGVPQPSIVSRAGWGADESLRTSCGTTYDTTIKAAVIHHTAGSNDYTAAQSASIVRGIYAYHVQGNGWCDIGYNFLVDKYGTIFEGRFGGIEKPVHGAHAGSWNTNTMGVSFMMNTDTVQPSDASMASAVALLAWKLAGYYRDPEGTTTLVGATQPVIFGHGSVMATDCPGTNLRARLQELRDRTRDLIAGRDKTPLYNLWWTAGSDGSTFGSVTQLERTVGTGRVVTFQYASGYQRPDGQVFWLGTGLQQTYDKAGGPTGSLGWPTSNQVNVAGVYSATFEHGNLVYPESPAYYVSFVKASYQDFLGRIPSQPEIDYQTGALGDLKTNKVGYLTSLATSDEWLNSIVTKFYTDTLGRAPDAAGLATWVSWLRSNRFTPAQVASQFYASNEYYAKGGGSASPWVTSLYVKLLNRQPDAAGLAGWITYTNNPAYGRSWVALQFYQSVESRQVRVTAMYQKLLVRAPDAAGLTFWVNRVLSTGDIALAVDIANSDEYWLRAQTRF